MPADFYQMFTIPVPDMGWATAMIRLVSALVLGALIGWERELHARAAGLRTHMMIAMAACLFTLVSYALADFPGGEGLRLDPLRLIEAVTAGVAFLAAGSIITSGGQVRGLTTGAGMWLAGAIGLCCGLGQIGLAALASLLAIIVLWLLRRLTARLGARADAADAD